MSYAPYHKQQTRKKIVRSAARLFNRRGFTEVTIGEIMTLAGLTHGGFYRHFNSMSDLPPACSIGEASPRSRLARS